MKLISRLIELLKNPGFWKGLFSAAGVWFVLSVACCVFGGIALYAALRKRGEKPYWPAFLPGGQTWCTLMLAYRKKSARLAERFLWWFPAAVLVALASFCWSAHFYLAGARLAAEVFLAVFGVAVAAGLTLYIWIRVLEFKALYPLFLSRCREFSYFKRGI